MTHHSWLITAHISLGHPECHWKTFNRQMDRTHQLLQFLSQWPSATAQLLVTLQVEVTNINDIYLLQAYHHTSHQLSEHGSFI